MSNNTESPNTEKLSSRKLRISESIEATCLADGTFVLKEKVRAKYMALTPQKKKTLELFDGQRTVQDILHSLLSNPPCPNIGEFYDLIGCALDRGILVDTETSPDESPETNSAISPSRWPLAIPPGCALIASLAFLALGAGAMTIGQPAMPMNGPGWLIVLVSLPVTLSCGNAAAACALKGFGRRIYRAGIRLQLGCPAFCIDARDAFMGGRICQSTVALQALSIPFLLSAAAVYLQYNTVLFATCFAAFVLSCPFGDTPAHDILHALFRKSYELPKCAGSFVKRKLLRQLLSLRKSLHEEEYLILYSVYTLLWLGAFLLFCVGLLESCAAELLDNALFAAQPGEKLLALIMIGLLTVMILSPAICQLWLLTRNIYTAIAPYCFRAEKKITQKRSPDRPLEDEIVSFLDDSLLFKRLSPEERRKTARAMTFVTAKPKTVFIREGDTGGDSLFVVYSGRVTVSKEDEAGRSNTVAFLGKGDLFGEIALLDNIPRTATVTGVDAVSVLILRRSDFEKLLLHSLGAREIRRVVQVCAFLKRNALFGTWPDAAIMQLADEFESVECTEGDVLVKEGTENDRFYLVYEGKFEVRSKGRLLKTLGSHDFFGEISLLKGIPPVASVSAGSPGRCLRLSRESFVDFISRDTGAALAVEDVLTARLGRHATG